MYNPLQYNGLCPSSRPWRGADFQVLIEKVGGKPEVLLVGESQEGKDTRALLAAFVQELFPDACKPGISPAMAVTQTQPGAKPGASNSRSQLIFFLCRASSLRGKQAEIQKILKEVKKFSRRAPAALVGVIVQPKKEEETEARKLMESVLQGAFPRQPLEVFIPGRPRGKLAIMKAACRATLDLVLNGAQELVQEVTITGPLGNSDYNITTFNIPVVGRTSQQPNTVAFNLKKGNYAKMRGLVKQKLKHTLAKVKSLQAAWMLFKDHNRGPT
uniref:Uncharacterized protein n=1 Tax=Gopherus evgoodei TaxID=1825980 RepID=A0A8C4YAV3_9SAUR